jgi:GNAT superfamily N-acetyltransferase
MTTDVRPATSWPDVREVMGVVGDHAHCQCPWFKLRNADYNRASVEDKAAMLRDQVEHDRVARGLLAYRDGEAAGWVAVEPRIDLPRITAGQIAKASPIPLDDDAVWAITCFVVRREHRRQGVARALIAAAVPWAIEHGARVIEGYPIDTSAGKASASELFHGSLTLFEDAGFRVVAEAKPNRPIVHLESRS